jgi:hypothetical protein
MSYRSFYDENRNEWVLRLNKYQRDNLLWLLNACGYGNHSLVVQPFTCANSGDWLGEIASMLAKPGKKCEIDADDQPNMTIEQLRVAVESWKRSNDS